MTVALLGGCNTLQMGKTLHVTERDWPMFGRSAERAGAAGDRLSFPLTTRWEHDISGGIGNGSPVVVDSFLFVGNLRGELHVINAFSGKRLGWFDLGEAIQGSPIVDGSYVYLAYSNTGESLVSFDMTESKPRWKKQYGDIEVSPLMLGKHLYFGNTAGTFYCVDRANGEEVWKFEIPSNKKRKGIRSSAAGSGNTVVFGADDGSLFALNAETGKELWRYSSNSSIVATPAIIDGVAYAGDLDGQFVAVGVSTGVVSWSVQTGSPMYSTATYSAGKIILGTTGGILFAFNPADGSVAWQRGLNGVISASAAAANDVIIVGTLKKELFAISATDGSELWKHTLGGRVKTAAAIAYGRVFVATDERMVIAFEGAGQ